MSDVPVPVKFHAGELVAVVDGNEQLRFTGIFDQYIGEIAVVAALDGTFQFRDVPIGRIRSTSSFPRSGGEKEDK